MNANQLLRLCSIEPVEELRSLRSLEDLNIWMRVSAQTFAQTKLG